MASLTTESVPEPEAPATGGTRLKAHKPKKDQLLPLVTKTGGTRISVLTERLGWQAHTVRAALSRLRKQGHRILATKAPKTREAVYQLVKPTEPTAPTEPMEPVEQAAATLPEGDAA